MRQYFIQTVYDDRVWVAAHDAHGKRPSWTFYRICTQTPYYFNNIANAKRVFDYMKKDMRPAIMEKATILEIATGKGIRRVYPVSPLEALAQTAQ